MYHSLRISTLLLILLVSFSSTSSADWRALLDDAKDIGSSFLSKNTSSSDPVLGDNTIISGLKEALDIGTRKAIESVSKPNGYLSNELIRIAMPPKLKQAGDLMRKFGLGSQADAFESSMNDAASKAAPAATNIIIDAIKSMSISDAKKLLNGSDNAATHYFKNKTSDQLASLFKPTISDSLNKVGTTKLYNDLTHSIADIPFVGEKINLDLSDYVTQQALSGLFTMIAQEEKLIRENPIARTTDLLKNVFGK